MLKKSSVLSIVMAVILLVATLPVSAYKIGDTVGYALTTDIVATINGYDIPSYNVDGYTYIVAEDLRYYGFSVTYDNASRSLSISRDYSQSWVSKSYTKPYVSSSSVGKRAHSLLYTDIKTYLDGYYTQSYNINGQTIIRFDALSAYGGVSYDNNKREISLGLSGLNFNPSPIDRSTTATDIDDEHLSLYYTVLDTTILPQIKTELNVYGRDFERKDLLFCMVDLTGDGDSEFVVTDSKQMFFVYTIEEGLPKCIHNEILLGNRQPDIPRVVKYQNEYYIAHFYSGIYLPGVELSKYINEELNTVVSASAVQDNNSNEIIGYEIHGKRVSKEEYDAFVESLEYVEYYYESQFKEKATSR